jgi:hypothetical protein
LSFCRFFIIFFSHNWCYHLFFERTTEVPNTIIKIFTKCLEIIFSAKKCSSNAERKLIEGVGWKNYKKLTCISSDSTHLLFWLKSSCSRSLYNMRLKSCSSGKVRMTFGAIRDVELHTTCERFKCWPSNNQVNKVDLKLKNISQIKFNTGISKVNYNRIVVKSFNDYSEIMDRHILREWS